MSSLPGYEALLPSFPTGGVLVLHAWWGMNQDVRGYCDRLSEAGFAAFAPDLFAGEVASTVEGAESLTQRNRPREEEIRSIIRESAEQVAQKSGASDIAVVGFSYGAYFALELSNWMPEEVSKVVIYYGTGTDDFSSSRAAYLGHFASDDDFEPAEVVESQLAALRGHGRSAEFFTYEETGHWFAEPSVVEAYDSAAAELAWNRTVQFLKRTG